MICGDGSRRPEFPPETLHKLFHAVDINDVVDTHVALPETIMVACPDDLMQQCFALCLQFWEDGVTRSGLWRLVQKLLRGEGWTTDERSEFKFIRARYKHLRFARQLYGKRHYKRNHFLSQTTISMGHLQDAFRVGDSAAIARHCARLRLLLAAPTWAMTRYTVTHTRLDNAAGFLAYRRERMRWLKETLAQAIFTGEEFHAMRKIVSEQVSYYDTLRSLDPTEDAYYKMSRFLAAINGLMGARHDEMVTGSQSGQRDYQTPAPLAEEIRGRLEMLVARYPF